jgi:uncharacterized membrane protein
MSSEDRRDEARRRHRSRVGRAVLALFRTRITTGVLTVLPILLTLWVLRLVFSWMRDASQWVIKAILLYGVDSGSEQPEALTRLGFDWKVWNTWETNAYPQYHEHFFELMPWHVQWGIAIFSVLLTLFVLYTIGLFGANLFGRRIIDALEQVVERVPMIKTIYRLPKQVISTFTATQQQDFRKAALVPFPQEKMRCVGFITNIFYDSVTGEELCSVFIPTTPNPTTGYLQILKRKELTELDWDVEDAIRTIMSGGILKPSFLTIVPNKDLPPDIKGAGRGKIPPPRTAAADPPDATRRKPGPE